MNDRKSSKGAGDNGGFNYQEVTSLLGTTGHDWEPEKAEEGGDPSNYRVASDWTTEQVA